MNNYAGQSWLFGPPVYHYGPRDANLTGPFWVYRVTDPDGVVLYVGESASPDRRAKTHRSKFPAATMILVASYPTRSAARAAEAAMIAAERPTMNRGGAK